MAHLICVVTGGVLKDGGKTDRSVRAVPLRKVVLDAMEKMPTRLDSRCGSPHHSAATSTSRSPPLRMDAALRSAGVPHRRLNDRRHTFATWAIESGIEFGYLARVMGTSIAQIEDTYARWLKRTDDQLRSRLDAYDTLVVTLRARGRPGPPRPRGGCRGTPWEESDRVVRRRRMHRHVSFVVFLDPSHSFGH